MPTYPDLTATSLTIGTSTSNQAGLATIGANGELVISSNIDPNTGFPAQLVRAYWENSAQIGTHSDSVAVIHGMGKNRLSIESEGAIIHIAKSGRYEFETQVYPNPIQFIGYGAASSAGVPFLFNNHNQSTYAASVVQVGVDTGTQVAQQWGTFNGSTFTPNAWVDGSGALTLRAALLIGATGSKRGFQVRSSTDSVARNYLGITQTDQPYWGMGLGGTTQQDTFIYRAAPNMWSMGGVPSSDLPALKREGASLQTRLADDSGFCGIQGKLTTHDEAMFGTIIPDSTLTLFDAAGNAYLVPCIAA